MPAASQLETIAFPSTKAFETWLRKNHDKAAGVWIQFYKKGSGVRSITYAEALDVALCHGWIDGQLKRLDDRAYLQRFTPRSARSIWSKRNRDHVARLIREGRMQPAGLREVERAKKDGRWDAAYDSPKNARLPDDFLAALDANAKAKRFFATLDKRNAYAITFRLHHAKKAETRARRIAKFVERLAAGEPLV